MLFGVVQCGHAPSSKLQLFLKSCPVQTVPQILLQFRLFIKTYPVQTVPEISPGSNWSSNLAQLKLFPKSCPAQQRAHLLTLTCNPCVALGSHLISCAPLTRSSLLRCLADVAITRYLLASHGITGLSCQVQRKPWTISTVGYLDDGSTSAEPTLPASKKRASGPGGGLKNRTSGHVEKAPGMTGRCGFLNPPPNPRSPW